MTPIQFILNLEQLPNGWIFKVMVKEQQIYMSKATFKDPLTAKITGEEFIETMYEIYDLRGKPNEKSTENPL